jgi:hypothetical protein
VAAEESVAMLKSTLEGISGIPTGQQLLMHNGRELSG